MTTTSATSASSNVLTTLGAGSGVDTQSLAESLVEAQRAPQKERLDAKIKKSEATISGYGALKYGLSQLKAAFEKFNDASDFASVKGTSTQAAVSVASTTATAAIGKLSVEVTQLARAQRNIVNFPSSAASLNGGAPFVTQVSVGGAEAVNISVNDPSPSGLVSAINSAKVGLKAQLLTTASGVAVVVTGNEGAANRFSIATNTSDVSFGEPVQVASDVHFKIDGVELTRPSNQVSDAVDGVTLNFSSLTSGPATLDLQRDTTALKENVTALVTAYNDFEELLGILGDAKSTVEQLGGALAGNSLLQQVRSQARALITTASSTPGASVLAARDIGLSFDRTGKMTFDDKKFASATATKFDEVVRMFSAGTSNKSLYSTAPAGVAGDAVVRLDQMLRTTGTITSQSTTAQQRIDKYKTDLETLEARMKQLQARYTRQFAAMDALVARNNSLRTGLTSSFEGLMAMYTKG